MHRRRFLGTILTVGGSTAVLLAHGADEHKGKPINGEVIATGPAGFDLKTDKGVLKISVTPKTTFERGEEAVSLKEITVGTHVAVFGTMLGDGKEVVAREVVYPEAKEHGHHHGGGHQH